MMQLLYSMFFVLLIVSKFPSLSNFEWINVVIMFAMKEFPLPVLFPYTKCKGHRNYKLIFPHASTSVFPHPFSKVRKLVQVQWHSFFLSSYTHSYSVKCTQRGKCLFYHQHFPFTWKSPSPSVQFSTRIHFHGTRAKTSRNCVDQNQLNSSGSSTLDLL